MIIGYLLVVTLAESAAGDPVHPDPIHIYEKSQFASFANDYFARFHLDPDAEPEEGETVITDEWCIAIRSDADPLAGVMAQDLADFIRRVMHLDLPVRAYNDAPPTHGVLLDHENGETGGFSISTESDRILIHGDNPGGLRDAVVKLVDLLGFRQAPFLPLGSQEYTPRLGLRVGVVPLGGSYRDAVFMGYDAVILSPTRDTRHGSATDFMKLSESPAISEWTEYQNHELLEAMVKASRDSKKYKLKRFAMLRMWRALPADDPVYVAHPEIRGAMVNFFMHEDPWGYVACTESPKVQQYLTETMSGIAEALELDGAAIIVGGEEFQHCYMRASNSEVGETNCERCAKLPGPTVVANLCNLLGNAIQQVNPDARLFAWPYSATFFWSEDRYQTEFIEQLDASVALLTEIEKEEVIDKAPLVQKSIWDYSIDLIGPGERAQRQIALARANGIHIYLKSEPELAFEAPGLPQIPCHDRWWDRANALASAGTDGAWVFPFYQPYLGNTSGEVFKHTWWEPYKDKETLLQELAARIAGKKAGPYVREAWKHVSKAIEYSPDMPAYYSGPYYLGPLHPMFADPGAELPAMYAHTSPLDPHFMMEPRGNVPEFTKFYRKQEQWLKMAVEQIDKAAPLVNGDYLLTFEGEAIPVRWFYHTARTHANFYETHLLCSQLLDTAADQTPDTNASLLSRLESVLLDEKENAIQASALLDADQRLEVSLHARLPSNKELMAAKLKLLDEDIGNFYPKLHEKVLGKAVPNKEAR